MSFELECLGKIIMHITLSPLQTPSKNVSERLLTYKEEMESKGMEVNAGKTKIRICCTRLGLL